MDDETHEDSSNSMVVFERRTTRAGHIVRRCLATNPEMQGWTDAAARNDSRPMPLLATFRPIRRFGLSTWIPALVLGLAFAARAGAAALAWSTEITPDGELFPVLDLSQHAATSPAAPGGGNGLVIIRVHGDDTPRHLRVTVETPGLREPAVVEANLERRGTVELRPRLEWSVDDVRALRAPRRQSVRVSLEASGLPKQTRDIGVRVHPLDDALYYVREGKDRIDLGWVFAAYVDPDDPVVAEIIASAREVDPGFDQVGFDHAGDDAESRERSARAIWTALLEHGLRYASGDPALSRGPSIYSQRVRLLADVWNERRANCLDGSVLIASVFERIGIPAYIALVPGHAFVGYRADGEHIEFLETTLLGDDVHATGGTSRRDETRDATASFAAARAAGRARWRRVESRFERRHGPDYALIDIGTARSYGIIPLGAHGEGRRGGARAVRTAAGLPRQSHPP
jgi:hypothetical protein